MKARLHVMTRAPVPGRVKTRLIPALGAVGAARLQAHLLDGLVERLVEGGLEPPTLWVDGPIDHPYLTGLAAERSLSLRAQTEGALGERMQAIIDTAFAANERPVLMGSDLPELSASTVRVAIAHLQAGAAAAIAPTEDGGFCLLALGQPVDGLFLHRTFSHAHVFEETLERLLDQLPGERVEVLARQWDVDTPADVERLTRLPAHVEWLRALPGPGSER